MQIILLSLGSEKGDRVVNTTCMLMECHGDLTHSILIDFLLFYRQNNSCESFAGQTIHMKSQVLFFFQWQLEL